jgi:hypothetical protein
MSSPPANPEQKPVLCKSPTLYYKMMQLAALLLLFWDFLLFISSDHKARLKIPARLNVRKKLAISTVLQSINSDKHLPQSLFTGKFLDYDILH